MPRIGTTSEAVHRHWAMLRLIPRSPRVIDTATIARELEAEGMVITRRSIQRDLESLALTFTTLKCHDGTKPYGWCWDGDSPLLEIPGMGIAAAVTFELVRQHLSDALPRSTVKTLEPHFQRARDVLAKSLSTKIARWPAKVRILPRGLRRRAPDVRKPILEAVYTALLEDRRLDVRYRKRGALSDGQYEVSPLGLVVRNGALLLVGTFWDYDDVNQMLLHRMTRATLVDKSARRPRGFDLDRYIAAGHIDFRRGEQMLRLRALIRSDVALSLHEAPIVHDQRLTPSKRDGWEELETAVPDTTELRVWLRGHGSLVEVLAPKSLRREMADEARATLARYDE
jgi:predicted DNA-binding transcriptional regulator YafY